MRAIGTIRLLSVAVTAAAAFLFPEVTVRANPAVPAGTDVLVVRTVPAVRDVRLALDGQEFTTDSRGVVRIDGIIPGVHTLQLLSERVQSDGMRATFSRWSDDAFTLTRRIILAPRQDKELQIGMDVEYHVGWRFVDQRGVAVDPSRVQKVVLGNSLGGRYVGASSQRLWVIAGRVSRTPNGLRLDHVWYSIRETVVDGTNVVNVGQLRFRARPNETWVIPTLFYTATLSVRDRFFGFPVGEKIDLRYPDGHVVSYPLANGSVTVRSLPRGEYDAVVKGTGVSLRVPLTISRDTRADLVYLSDADVAVATLMLVFFAIGLLVLGRRRQTRETRREQTADSNPQGMGTSAIYAKAGREDA